MERIKFKYLRTDDYDDSNTTGNVKMDIQDKNDCGLLIGEVCETFVHFMEAVGFTENQVLDYFKEYD